MAKLGPGDADESHALLTLSLPRVVAMLSWLLPLTGAANVGEALAAGGIGADPTDSFMLDPSSVAVTTGMTGTATDENTNEGAQVTAEAAVTEDSTSTGNMLPMGHHDSDTVATEGSATMPSQELMVDKV